MASHPSQPLHPEVIEELITARGSKWTMPVVLHLKQQTMRFSELQRDIGTISQKALTSTLRTLERNGFVSRTGYATIPPRVDYALTDLGREILAVYEVFELFAARRWHEVLEARRAFDMREQQEPSPLLRVGTAR